MVCPFFNLHRFAIAALVALTTTVSAQQPGDADYPQPSPTARHDQKVAAVKSGKYDMVLIGDSITPRIKQMTAK